MKLTVDEKRTVRAVLVELLKKPYWELNCFLGSLTIEEMRTLYLKLRYEEYCDERGIKFEDMTVHDCIAAEERARRYWGEE